MLKKLSTSIKNYLPFLGITSLYFFFIAIAVIIFHYFANAEILFLNRVNPFHLLMRWDSWHYITIIQNGYSDLFVFFPLYPLLVKLVSYFVSIPSAGYLVSFISLSIALTYLYKLLRLDEDKLIANRTILFLLIFPTALFFSLIYTESLFLALTVAFFYQLRKKHWLTATILGFFVTLTRNVGVFLWPVYLIALFTLDNPSLFRDFWTRLKSLVKTKQFYYSFLIPAGLLLFCLYSYYLSGDFLAFITGQQNWSAQRTFMWPGATAFHFLKFIFIEKTQLSTYFNFYRIVIVELGSFLLLLSTTIYWFVKRHWPFAFYTALNALLFACTFPMNSVDRYVVVIFPIFLFLAKVTRKREWLFYTIFAFSLMLLVNSVRLISAGAWVG